MAVFEITLGPADRRQIDDVLEPLTKQYQSVEDAEFQRRAAVAAHELPSGLRDALIEFKLTEPAGACLVRGFDVDDAAIGPTPKHWNDRSTVSSALREEIFFCLCAQLLGDPVAWATEQNGYVMHDILPIIGHEREHIDSGSEILLTWHTEVAFHPYRADYIGLMCLRNLDAVETTYADVGDLSLDENDREVLRRDLFVTRPDEIHLNPERSSVDRQSDELSTLIQDSYQWVRGMNDNPVPRPVLFGSKQKPYICLDPYSMDEPGTPEARAAFEKICAEVERKITGIALRPGDILFIDNFMSVHGRKPFQARFDGTDRWLKRLNLVRDLRKSRSVRVGSDSRVIY
ncbi:guanitoxin biosynthesis L-enduracididine beta-hydroxylase GntD [Micromonospora sp. CPCC 206061]|uniref:guanitoxin biosynthesis L-enduracididine beta-hydroxylase GntD n=1 Tax=Micromonospora sp. CPCC 206061 TaxID=3122410 RepID=UPI002FF41EF2